MAAARSRRPLVEYRNDVIHGAGVLSVGIEAASVQITSWLNRGG